MSGFKQAMFIIGLGMFWGVMPTMNKLLGIAGIPVVAIMTVSGFGVALGMAGLQRAMGGRLNIDWPVISYGLGCGVLNNAAWALALLSIRHVPIALWAVITSTTPIWTYVFALALGRELPGGIRALALVIGFASSLALIVTRPGTWEGKVDGWILITLAIPVLYACYNLFTSVAWPAGMAAATAGTVESAASSLLTLPFAVLFWPRTGAEVEPTLWGYVLLATLILLWVLERVSYFNLIRTLGPVTTVQADFVATPSSVIMGLLFFGEKADIWLWVSLGLIMISLWLNNRAVRPQTSPAPAPAP